MTDDPLEAALRDLGHRVHVPEPPDVTARVLTRIDAPRRRNRWLTGVVAAVTAFAIAFAVSPAVRAGVRDLLEFAGVEFRTQAPTSTAPPLPSREVSLDDARAQLPFEIHLPSELGAPDRVTVHEGRFVSLRYGGIRLDQFDGGVWHLEEPGETGQTLIWQRGQVTTRLEGPLTRERALRISGS
ncbi:hypothetical protein [Lentzea sp.]|uniref:hypothetical protein n=1 Tax=Lentzea sp. TaxID=56099 RepID=UPI002ED27F50